MQFSPRLDGRLVEVIRRADVERMSIADVWRLAGGQAVELGLCRPGYHSVLHIVREERRRRAERREAILAAAEQAWAYTGTDYEALVRGIAATRRP